MRSVFIAFLMFMFSGMAFADSHSNSSDCYFDVSFNKTSNFQDYRDAERWCTTIRGVFDDFDVCNFRQVQHSDYSYQGIAKFERRFGGSTFNGIMRDYTSWTHGRVWRGNNLSFNIQYFGSCLRGRGGGGYGY